MSDSSGVFAVASDHEGAVSVIPACAPVSAGLYDRNFMCSKFEFSIPSRSLPFILLPGLQVV